MNKNGKVYEPPKAKIYRFDDNEKILTASSDIDGGGATTTQVPDYAARALNELMGGTNTTIEQ